MHYKMKFTQLQSIFDYLKKRPYEEVNVLVTEILKLKPEQDEPVDSSESQEEVKEEPKQSGKSRTYKESSK